MDMSNGKSSEDDNIKSAADLLLKGGTLLSNSCENCGGVQVRFKENIVCVSCGRKAKEINLSQIEEEKKKKGTSININNNNNNNDSSFPSSKEMQVQTNSAAAAEDDIDGSSNIKLKAYKRIIYKKITLLITSIADDNDIFIQNTKLDLISKYLDIFNKLKYINNENN
jgi:uncharacterized Zn finger protein (UPF0148 family)